MTLAPSVFPRPGQTRDQPIRLIPISLIVRALPTVLRGRLVDLQRAKDSRVDLDGSDAS